MAPDDLDEFATRVNIDTAGEFHLSFSHRFAMIEDRPGPAPAPEELSPRESAMSLHPRPDFPIPDQTRRVAHAAFPKGFCALCCYVT
jgi:hypothetical protein